MRIVFLLCHFCFFATAFSQQKDLARYVNPFIGTGGTGHTFPGATVPFGLVQLSPETGTVGWDYCAGYRYEDSVILGFSHTHLSGTGAMDLADVLLLPFTGPAGKYSSRFSHKEEAASPGYYRVRLQDFKVDVALTATAHAGMHRYSYPADSDRKLLIDLKHGLANNEQQLDKHVLRSEISMQDKQTLMGYRVTSGWGGERHVYFAIQLSEPALDFIPLHDSSEKRNKRVVLSFGASGKPLYIKLGLSTVSAANALENLSAEIPGWDFGEVKQQSRRIWNQRFNSIDAEGSDYQKTIFYTALYHSLIAPNNIADKNGQYRGADNTVAESKGKTYYSTLSLWDTYRALNPLFTIICPEVTSDIVNSMLAHTHVAGYLPVWTLWGHENHCMIGNHSIPVITDAYLKGIRGFDVQAAYRAIKTSSTVPHKNSDWEKYMRYGYLPFDSIKVESASTTLESAYDDWCVAQMAKALGHKEDAALFSKRAGFYKHLWDSTTGFMRGRKSTGEWRTPFDPLQLSHAYSVGGDFTEGNAMQYSWHVQQDVPGLIELMGGNKAFIQKLDRLFSTATDTASSKSFVDVTGLIGQYAHGNEPSHHVAYLYTLAGAPAKTEARVAEIMNTQYSNKPDGLSGNDDCGQMSAWYLFSAMGFYPVNPASLEYVVGAPQLPGFVLHLPGGKTFTIKVHQFSEKHKKVKFTKLNGRPLLNHKILHSDIMKGGTLEFWMEPDVPEAM